MKPLIGLLPLIDYQKKSYWMLPGYMQGIEAAGGIPVMLPLTDCTEDINTFTHMCDGFLFTGGQDVSPEIYNEKKIEKCGECSYARDKMELMLLNELLSIDKPVLGICRGIQFINAALGGTLYQDIPSQTASDINHHQKPPYDIPVHKVILKKESPIHNLLKKDILSVNSYHHQAIKNLAPPLKVMATATDGIIEGVYLPEKKFLWAIQWHPELSYKTDEDSAKIFAEFVKACIA